MTMKEAIQTDEMKDVDDIQIITHYPITYAKETFVILRRLAFLKLMIQNSPPSQQEALDDSKEFGEFIKNLIESKGMNVSQFIRFNNPSVLSDIKSYLDDEDENDD